MKKWLIALALFLAIDAIRIYGCENEFTWAKYELFCYSHGQEPSWQEYNYLVQNPQCYGDENEIELSKLLSDK